mmetsp:Transcript_67458/g.75557  ORF Transcript_67458/g.75557 Transcript_67458/m.75557 type:complete len:527 (-) Transcript_67458:49-1629(-)
MGRIITIFGLCAVYLNTCLYLRQDSTVSAFLVLPPVTSATGSRNHINDGIILSTSITTITANAAATAADAAAVRTLSRKIDNTRIYAVNNPGGGDSGFGELTSALTKLDDQWKIQQRSSNTVGKPRWKKLILPKEVNIKDVNNEDQTATTTTTTQDVDDYVWMLEPPNSSIPSCIVVFTGGAGLGQFPQVVYNELLSKISVKLNAICITAPYEVGLDHFALAKQTGELIRRSLLFLNDDEDDNQDKVNDDNSGSDSSTSTSTTIVQSQTRRLPTFSLAHSLGCKLQTIYMAATGIGEDTFDGVGFMAYNNFSFAKTITMARSFAQELRQATSTSGRYGNDAYTNKYNNMNNNNDDMINNIFNFAEMAVGAIGVDFSPNALDTERLIQLRYNDILQSKTRLFIFDDDNLDSSREFEKACNSVGPNDVDGGSSSNNSNLSVSNLPGGHLSPVYFQLNTDELVGDFEDGIGAENIDMAKEAMGGFQGASFGEEEVFDSLVDEITDWILGKSPSSSFSSNRYQEQGSALP